MKFPRSLNPIRLSAVLLMVLAAILPSLAGAAVPNVTLSQFFTNNLSYAVAGNPVNVSGEYQLAVRDPWALLYDEKFGGYEPSYLWKSDDGSGNTPKGIVNFGGGSFQFKSPNAATTAWYYPYNTTLKVPVSVFGIRIANHTGTSTGCDVGVGIYGRGTSTGYVIAKYHATNSAYSIVIEYKKGASAAVTTTVATLSAALPANSELMLIHNGRSFSAAVNDGAKETIYGNVDLDTTSFYDLYDEATLNTFSPAWYFSSAASGLDTTINEVWERVFGTVAEREVTAINYVEGDPVIIDGFEFFIADSGRPQGVNSGADALSFAKAAALAAHGMVRQYSPARNAFVGYTGVMFMRNNGHIYPAQQPRTYWDSSRNSWLTLSPDWYNGAFYAGNGQIHNVYLFETKQDVLHGVTIFDTANSTNLSATLPFPAGVDSNFYDPDIIKTSNGQILLGGTVNDHGAILFRGSSISNINQFVAHDTNSGRQMEGFRFFKAGGNVGIIGGGFNAGGMHVWDDSLNYVGLSYAVTGGSAPSQYNILPIVSRGKTTYVLTGFTTSVFAASKPRYDSLLNTTVSPSSYLGGGKVIVHFPFNEPYSGTAAITTLHGTNGINATGTATMQDGICGGEAKFLDNGSATAGDSMVGNVNPASIATLSKFTLLVKVRPAATNNTDRAIFSLWNGAHNSGNGTVLLMTDSSRHVKAYVTQADGTVIGAAVSTTVMTPLQSYWLVVLADGTNLKVYVDTLTAPEVALPYTGLKHDDTNFGIACQPNAAGTAGAQLFGSFNIENVLMVADDIVATGGASAYIGRQGNIYFDGAHADFTLGSGLQQQTTMGKMFAIPLGTYSGEEYPQRTTTVSGGSSGVISPVFE